MPLDWQAVEQSCTGFVIQMASADQYDSVAAFRQHLAQIEVAQKWEEDTNTLHVGVRDGETEIAFGYKPTYRNGSANECFPYRTVNGEWPYLADGIDRDTTVTVQGNTGKLAKNGAVLKSERGAMSYLAAIPEDDRYVGLNPVRTPRSFSLSTPEGWQLTSPERVGILRAELRPGANLVDLGAAPGGRDSESAALVLTGTDAKPTVRLNGTDISDRIQGKGAGKQAAWVIPLKLDDAAQADPTAAIEAVEGKLRFLELSQDIDIPATLIQEWQILGPFPNQDRTGFATAYPPEQAIDLDASYEGKKGTTISWTHIELSTVSVPLTLRQ